MPVFMGIIRIIVYVLFLMILKWIILTKKIIILRIKNIYEVIVTFDKDVITKIFYYNLKKVMYQYSVEV
jgi:hypothetical protein